MRWSSQVRMAIMVRFVPPLVCILILVMTSPIEPGLDTSSKRRMRVGVLRTWTGPIKLVRKGQEKHETTLSAGSTNVFCGDVLRIGPSGQAVIEQMNGLRRFYNKGVYTVTYKESSEEIR